MTICAAARPASGCGHIIKGETEEEALKLAAQHAKESHGMEPTPELLAMVEQHMTEA